MSSDLNQICFSDAVVSREEFELAVESRAQAKREKINAAYGNLGNDKSVGTQLTARDIYKAQLNNAQRNKEFNEFSESVAAAMPYAENLISKLCKNIIE